MKKHHKGALAGVAMVSALSLAACGSSEPGEGEPITLTMSTFLDPNGQTGRDVALRELIDSFEEEHEGVTVEVQTSQWSMLAPQFMAAAASGNAPDLAWVTVLDLDPVLENQLFSDISGAFSDEDKEDLNDAFWERLTEGEETYGAVLSRVAMGYLYRADLFEEAGISPEDLDTWDKFTDAVSELADDDQWGFCQGFSEATSDVTTLAARMVHDQGTLFADDGSPMWDTPEAVGALEYTVGLVEDGITPPDSVTWSSEDPYEQFSAGNCVAAMAAATRVPTIQEQAGEDQTGFALFPAGEGTSNAINGWTVGVWSGSEHQEAAAEFAAHLISPEADRLWVETAGQSPARQSTAEELELPEFLQVADAAFDDGWLPPAGSGPDYRPVMNQIVLDVMTNGQDPATALQNAAEEFAAD